MDSGFYSTELLRALRREKVRFTVSVPRSQAMWRALGEIPDSAWQKAEGMFGAEVEAELFHRVGGFTHGYFYGGEDEGLCLKLREQGSPSPNRESGRLVRGFARLIGVDLHSRAFPMDIGVLAGQAPAGPLNPVIAILRKARANSLRYRDELLVVDQIAQYMCE